MSEKTLYERLGGYEAISAVTNDLLSRLQADSQLARFWQHRGADGLRREKQLLIDFHGRGFSPRFSRASGSRGTNHRLQASRPSGGGSIRRKAFQAGVYPPPAQPTGFSR